MPKPLNILLVEDNLADAKLVTRLFPDPGIRFHHVRDGEEALAYLRGATADPRGSVPQLILLDLNLPRRNGAEVLEEIRKMPPYREIPVLVLSSSEDARDVRRCYELGANCFLSKPDDLDDLIRLLQGVEGFWFKLARIPEVG